MGYVQGEERTFRPGSAPGASIVIRTPTERTNRRMVDGAKKKADGSPDVYAAMELAVELGVVSVSGYTHRGRAICTAQDLVEYADARVLIEVGAEIITEASLTEEERGFLGSPSDSSATDGSTSKAPAELVAAPAP